MLDSVPRMFLWSLPWLVVPLAIAASPTGQTVTLKCFLDERAVPAPATITFTLPAGGRIDVPVVDGNVVLPDAIKGADVGVAFDMAGRHMAFKHIVRFDAGATWTIVIDRPPFAPASAEVLPQGDDARRDIAEVWRIVFEAPHRSAFIVYDLIKMGEVEKSRTVVVDAKGRPTRSRVAGWVGEHLAELVDRTLPTTSVRDAAAAWVVRCREDSSDGLAQVTELSSYTVGDVRLRRRKMTESDWLEAVQREVDGGVPLDVAKMVARLPVMETAANAESCPSLATLAERAEKLHFPGLVPSEGRAGGPMIVCEFSSWGNSQVRVNLRVNDADAAWKPFIQWVRDLAAACPNK